jgi:tetratricopeptide (TPR) repeat protein
MNTSPSAADQALRLRTQAIEYLRSNRMQAAQEALEALVRIKPQEIPACLELANLMAHQGQFRASSAPLLTAMKHLSRNAQALQDLAKNLNLRGEVIAARACLDHLSQLPNLAANTLVDLAGQRHGLGEIDVACELMQRAFSAGAGAPGHYLLYSALLVYTGQEGAAREVLETCISRWPDFGNAAAALMRLSKQTPQDNRLAYVEEQLRRLPVRGKNPSARANVAAFEYARFKILDDLGRHGEAWLSLERSKSLMHELKPYDAAVQQSLVDALVGMPPMSPGPHDPARDGDGPVPIFIVGLPRSGSTLLDRMLSAHSQVASAGELIVFWRQLHWVADVPPAGLDSLRHIAGHISGVDLETVGRRYLESMGWHAGGRRFFIDKLPANIQLVSLIRAALPQARIINMLRDPMDVCLSNFQLFGHQATYVNDLDAIADYHRLYLRLCARWHELSPDMMLDVSYEDLAHDPQSTMQRVLDYCGLESEEACLHPERNSAPVATPSSIQVREPIHTRSIGRWRAYAEQLEPLRRALG